MMMSFMFLLAAALFSSSTPMSKQNPSPILVELFTSEGCSSCPPADRLLQQLDQSQPIAGAQIIVLSEHVDYWNSIGWKDPYSSEFFSKRQSAYASHFGLNSIYTPQMVVDGSSEFVGSNAGLANSALEKALGTAKAAIRLTAVSLDSRGMQAHVETDAISDKADIFLALALNRADSNVTRGENTGRHLTHVGVVQRLEKIGSVAAGSNFSRDIQIPLPAGADPSNLRAIVFAQQPGQGKILGATLQAIHK